jgi:hypothetical protein
MHWTAKEWDQFCYESSYLPADLELAVIIGGFQDDDSIETFRLASNEMVGTISRTFMLDKTQFLLERKLCQLTGISHETLVISRMRRHYYFSLFSGIVYNPRVVLELTQGTASFRGVRTLSENHHQAEERLCQMYPAFNESTSFFYTYRSVIQNSTNPEVQKLLLQIKPDVPAHAKRLYSAISKKKPPAGLPHDIVIHSRCEFCSGFFSIDRRRGCGKAPRHCANPGCIQAYERSRKKSSRAIPHSQRTEGLWTSAYPKKRRCKECRMQRLLNTEGVCKSCFAPPD